MKKTGVFLLMLIATVGWGQTPTLGDLRESDRREIKEKVRQRIENLDELFNQLIDKDLGDFEFSRIIDGSCNFSSNQIFYQDNIRITNDYNPVLVGKEQVIKDYFSDFQFLKKDTLKKDTDARFRFKIETIDELRQGSYLYLEVNYSLKFDGYYENRIRKNGKIAIEKIPFKEQHKMAELRAEKKGKNWELLITKIANNESFKPPVLPNQPAIVKTEPKAVEPIPKADVAKPTETKVATAPQTNTSKPAEIKPKPVVTQTTPKVEPNPIYSDSKSNSGSVLTKIAVAVAGVGAGLYGYSLNSTFQSAKSELETISASSGTTVSSQNAAQYNTAYDKALAAQGKKGLSATMLGVAGVAVLFEAYLLFKPSNNNTSGFKIQPASAGVGVGIGYHF
jgi:hypothetical protein